MTPQEIAKKTKKVIQMNKDSMVINSFYFNPVSITDLTNKVPELVKAGLVLNKTETETNEGTTVTATVNTVGYDSNTLHLGSVLLDGESVIVKNSLSTVDKLIQFIAASAGDTDNKNVEDES